MIERLTAASGDEVLRVNGRLTASRVDPRAEARAWAAARGVFLNQVDTVIVLGLGSGYHVSELVTRTSAAILVIEPNAALAAQAPVTLDPSRVSVVTCANLAELRATPEVRRAVSASYVTLIHPASRAATPELYADFSRQLNARAWGSLGWVWAMRGQAGADELANLIAEEPLTIYDLAQSEVVQNADERQALLIKALRELVK